MTLNLGGGIVLPCNLHMLEVADPPAGLKSLADIDWCNQLTFDLIQRVQKAETDLDRKMALNKLVVIDSTLDARMQQFMKIKDRQLKKKLIGQLLECNERTSHFIGLLRGVQDLSNISNEIIAKMNDLGN